ncbi:hypothetical protein CTI12_AA272520 [Artemisia annua]|uniref:Reverse transcriptase/retrotransposon-derived protein RNase H-like domain-containing protein n=1 Tax=Artemisia annua TaxID=35608 RepID=A0A2U1NFC9_ARTAN|nr:hypothetical protein CTI12_AA272520 [Artemisia annua]
MVDAPVVALPNFRKTFIMETHALGLGIATVLQQEGHRIAYLSKTLSTKHWAVALK